MASGLNPLKAQCIRKVEKTVFCKNTSIQYVFFVRPLAVGADTEYWSLLNLNWQECGSNAYLTGVIKRSSDNNYYQLDVTFSGRTTSSAGYPHSCYDYQTNDWYYFTSTSGTLRNITTNDGVVHRFSRDGDPFQVGTDANITDQDNEYGGSGWIEFTASDLFLNGDINIRLGPCTSTFTQIRGDESRCGGYNPDLIEDGQAGFYGVVDHRWQQNAGSGWTTISGATGAEYNPPSITKTTQYRRQDRFGGCTDWVTSNVITKEVVSNFTNGGTINGGQTVCDSYGSKVIGSSSVPSGGSGGVIEYLWQYRKRGSCSSSYGSWITWSGQTDATATWPEEDDEDVQFRRRARRSVCTGWVNSNVITIDITEPLTNPGSISGGVTYCNTSTGQTHNFGNSSAASGGCGGSLQYQWQFRYRGSCESTYNGWTNWSGRTSATASFGGHASRDYQFRRGAKRSNCTDYVYSNIVTVEVTEPLTNPGSISGGGTYCNTSTGQTHNFGNSSAASGGCGGSLQYQWQFRYRGSCESSYNGWTNWSGRTSATASFGGHASRDYQFRRGAKRSDCTDYVYSNVVTVEITEPLTNPGSISGGGTYCNTSTGQTHNFGNSSAPSGGCRGSLQYQWQFRYRGSCESTYNGWTNWSGRTSATTSFGGHASRDYQFRRGAKRSDCTDYVYSNIVTVEVTEPLTNPGSISGGGTYCNTSTGQTHNFGNSSAASGGCGGSLQYQWQFRYRGSCESSYNSWANWSGRTSATTSFGGHASRDYQFRRGAKRSNCTDYVYSNVVTVEVTEPLTNPGSISGGGTYCNTSIGQTHNFGNSSAASGGCGGSLQYQWQFRYRGSCESTYNGWTNWSGRTSATASFGGHASRDYQFRRGAKRSDCTDYVYSNVVTVEVEEPLTNAGSINGGGTFCGNTGRITFNNTQLPTGGCGGTIQYIWEYRNKDACSGSWGSWTNWGRSSASETMTSGRTDDHQFRRGARRVGCGNYIYSNVVTLEVEEPLTNAGSINGGGTFCGNTGRITFNNTQLPTGGCGGTIEYIWEYRTKDACSGSWGTWTNWGRSSASETMTSGRTDDHQFRRGARRVGCGNYIYSNVVTLEVEEPLTNAGSINGGGTFCGNTGRITFNNTQLPTGGCGGTIQYIWEYRTKDACSGSWGSWTNWGRSSASETMTSGRTDDHQFRRGARRVGCGNYIYSNVVTLEVEEPLTNAGSINGGGTFCGNTGRITFNNTQLPTGGCGGTIQYIWEYRTKDACSGSWGSWTNWGRSSASETMTSGRTDDHQFRRGARRVGCGNYIYSNVVTLEVEEPLTNAGSINGGGTFCGNTGRITFNNTQLPTGGCGGTIEYIWEYRTKDACSGSWGTWTNWGRSSASETMTSGRTDDHQFRRGARRVGCGNYIYSNVVTLEVEEPLTNAGSINGGGTFCDSYNPPLITNVSAASGGCDAGGVTYLWQSRTNGETWTNISGATAATYNPGVISATTDYRRQAKRATCGSYLISNIVTFTRYNAPSVSISADDLTVCLGESVRITSEVSGGTGTCGIQWQRRRQGGTWSNFNTGATVNPASYLSAPGVYQFRAIYDCDGASCGTATSNVVNVEVVADPSISISADDLTVCLGETVDLSSSVSGGTGSCTRQWQRRPQGGTWSNWTISNNVSAGTGYLSSPGVYQFRAIYDCDGASCGTATSNVVNVEVVADPSISISADDLTVCLGESVRITSEVSGGTGTCGIQWQRRRQGGTWSNFNTGATVNPASYLSARGVYQFRAIYDCNGASCGAATSNVINVEVFADPSVSISSDKTEICLGDNVELTYNLSGGTGSCDVQWQRRPQGGTWEDFGAGQSPRLGGAGWLATAPGVYQYRALYDCDGASCGAATSNVINVEVTPCSVSNCSTCGSSYSDQNCPNLSSISCDQIVSSGTITVQDNTTYCITGNVTLTGNILNNTIIYVASGGTVNCLNVNVVDGLIINCGTFNQGTSNFGGTSSFVLENYGVFNSGGTGIQFENDRLINYSTGKLNVAGVLEISSNSEVHNYGDIVHSASGGSVIFKSGSCYNNYVGANITTVGNFLIENGAVLNNNGIFSAEQDININTGSLISNCCTLHAYDRIIINGILENNGIMLVDNPFQGSTNGKEQFIVNKQFTNNGFVVGGEFLNNATVTGDGGEFYFEGITNNNGTFKGSNASNPLVFGDLSDTGRSLPRTQADLFDNGHNHKSPDNTFVNSQKSLPFDISVVYEQVIINGSCTIDIGPTTVELCDPLDNGGTIGADQEICGASGDPVLLTNVTTPTGGSKGIEYVWMQSETTCNPPSSVIDPEWAVIAGATSAIYNPPAINVNTCYVRLSKREDCTYYENSNVVNIELFADPSVSISSDKTEICLGDNVELTYNLSGGTGSCDVQWQRRPQGGTWEDFGTGKSPRLGGAGWLATAPGIYQYRALYECNNASCDISISNVIDIEVLALPNITNISPVNEVCGESNGTITFEFTDNPNRNGLEFSIDGGNTYLPQVNDNLGSYTVNDLAPATYDLWVRWVGNECPIHLDNVSISAENLLPPICEVNVNNSGWIASNDCSVVICEGEFLALNVNTTASLVVWNGPNEFTATGHSITFPNIQVNQSGEYAALVTDNNGCNAAINFTVKVGNTGIDSVIAIAPSNCPILDNGYLEIVATGSNLTYSIDGGVTYQDNNQFTGLSQGTFSILVQDTITGCSDSREVTLMTNPCEEICINGEDDDSDSQIDTDDEDCNCPLGLENMALGKIATQSSTSNGGGAMRAIDGNTSGVWQDNSVTHTQGNVPNNYWELDLREERDIKNIVLWNRTDDCCSDRLSFFYVFVSDLPFTSTDPILTAAQTEVWSIQVATLSAPSITVSPYRTGRYVRVQLANSNSLSLAEVEVFGCTIPENCTDGIDNDNDGLIDCEDPDCELTSISTVIGETPSNCPVLNNGMLSIVAFGDNLQYSIDDGATYQNTGVFTNLMSGNYAVRVRDSLTGCFSTHNANPVIIDNPTCIEICDNGIDDDGDGLADCADSDCSNFRAFDLRDDNFNTCPGSVIENTLRSNDSITFNAIYTLDSPPIDGSATINYNGSFAYTPASNNCQNDSFTYQVCDTLTGCCAIANVFLDLSDDEQPELVNVPEDETIHCDEIVPTPPFVSALDNCPGIQINLEEMNTRGEDGCGQHQYELHRIWTATDQCGNQAVDSQRIDVVDLAAPDIFRIYTLPNGKKMVAGVTEYVSHRWKTISLPISFPTQALVFTQVITETGSATVVPRIRNVSDAQFELKLQAEEANSADKLVEEKVAWIAIEAGQETTTNLMEIGSLDVDHNWQTFNFQQAFSQTPAIITTSQTFNGIDPITVRCRMVTNSNATILLEEETSLDSETDHALEEVAYWAVTPTDTIKDENNQVFGESGSINIDHLWTKVNTVHTYTNPVMIASVITENGGAPVTVRIDNVQSNSFDIRLQEWNYDDGSHAVETVNYIIVEGSIPLDASSICEVGTDGLKLGEDLIALDNCDANVALEYEEATVIEGGVERIIRTWYAQDECGNATGYSQVVDCAGVGIQLKAILQGAMIGGEATNLMRDDLREKGIIPLTEPYTAMPAFTHYGTGGEEEISTDLLEITGKKAIVDWVFVELRSSTNQDQVVATKSALIQRNGQVVSYDGNEVLYFKNLPPDNYFVCLRHRNHIQALTLHPYECKENHIPFIDFTNKFLPTVGNESFLEVDNKNRMWSGDLNQDDKTIFQGPGNDIFPMFIEILTDSLNLNYLPNYIDRGYTINDFNMDGITIFQGPNNDRSTLLFNTILNHPLNSNSSANFVISTNNVVAASDFESCLVDPSQSFCDFDRDGVLNEIDPDDDDDGVVDGNDIDAYFPDSDSDQDGVVDSAEKIMNSDPLNPCSPYQDNAICEVLDQDEDGYYGNYPSDHLLFDANDLDACTPNNGEVNCNCSDEDNDGYIYICHTDIEGRKRTLRITIAEWRFRKAIGDVCGTCDE